MRNFVKYSWKCWLWAVGSVVTPVTTDNPVNSGRYRPAITSPSPSLCPPVRPATLIYTLKQIRKTSTLTFLFCRPLIQALSCFCLWFGIGFIFLNCNRTVPLRMIIELVANRGPADSNVMPSPHVIYSIPLLLVVVCINHYCAVLQFKN